jgi:RNA polymerase sigma-70 factor (ECF subfamily)
VENQTDSSLMMLVQAGETSQLAVLFERHHLPLFRYLLHLTRNQTVSEDLAQEAFMRVLKYASTYNPNLGFPVWLFGIARNLYFDSLRRKKAESISDGFTDIRSSDPMPEELVTRKQDVTLLEKALQQLPSDKREVLVLSRFQNLRYEEIARLTSCEVGTVKVRVYRALKQLRENFRRLHEAKAAQRAKLQDQEGLYDI